MRSHVLGYALCAGAMAACLAGIALAADEFSSPSELPWSLRDRYTFQSGPTALVYAVDNGEWRITHELAGIVLDKVQATITLGDGRIVQVTGNDPGSPSRRHVSTPYGPAAEYAVDWPAREGLVFRHAITALQEHPFYLVHVGVTNTTPEAVGIRRICPLAAPAGSLQDEGDGAMSAERTVAALGGSLVYSAGSPGQMILIHDPVKKLCLVLCASPGTNTGGLTRVSRRTGPWDVVVASEYAPDVLLDPGETLESESAFVAFGEADPVTVGQHYAWVHRRRNPHAFGALPLAWVTIAGRQTPADLAHATREWWPIGVRHALVPADWEFPPGSLRGAPPDYPVDMRAVAVIMRESGISPGISVDPLVVQGGKPDWSLQDKEGQYWLNPSHPKAREFAVKRMRRVVDWGFEFFVLHPSRVPDSVLADWRLTRAQADHEAFMIIAEAAGKLPVMAGSRGQLEPERDAWLAAAAATAWLSNYQLPVGPVRFDVSGLASIDEETLAAMALYRGPIEFVGIPSPRVRRQLESVCTRPRGWVWPVDAAAQAPKVWRILPPGVFERDGARTVGFSGISPEYLGFFDIRPDGLAEVSTPALSGR